MVLRHTAAREKKNVQSLMLKGLPYVKLWTWYWHMSYKNIQVTWKDVFHTKQKKLKRIIFKCKDKYRYLKALHIFFLETNKQTNKPSKEQNIHTTPVWGCLNSQKKRNSAYFPVNNLKRNNVSFHLTSTGQHRKITITSLISYLCCVWSKKNIKVWRLIENMGFKI